MNLFNFTAAQWTQNYAKIVTEDDKVAKLQEMGFDETTCRDALSRYGFDEQLALNFLLGG